MKRIFFQGILWIFLGVNLIFPTYSLDTLYPYPVEGLDDLLEQVEAVGVNPESSWEEGVDGLMRQGISLVSGFFRGGVTTGLMLLAVVLLCGVAEGASLGEKEAPLSVVTMAGALTITTLSVGEVGTMIDLGQETIGKISSFSSGLLPVMSILTAATGGITAGVARQGVTMFFSGLLISLINHVLLPLVYAYLAVCCANASVGNDGLAKVAGLIKSTVIGFLTAFLILFVTYITVSGTIAGSADLVAVRTTKIALSRAVPVVGGILSDAAETVLVGAGMLRGTVGVAGMLAVLSICLVPFLQLSIHYMSYKITAALAGTVANPRLSQLIEEISAAFGLILGMTGACALLLLVSIISGITAVIV